MDGNEHERNFTVTANSSPSSARTAALRAATSVAAIAAVCGAFYIGTVFSGGREAGKPSNPKPVTAAVAPETTGAASKETQNETQDLASAQSAPGGAADCQEQTWPYIARPCLSHEQGKRGVRVISTDKLSDPVISMVQAPPDVVTNRKTPPPEPAKQAVTQAAPVVSLGAASVNKVAPLKSGAALGAVVITETAKSEPAKSAPAEQVVVVQPEPAKSSEPEKPAEIAAAPVAPQPAVQVAFPAGDVQAAPNTKPGRDVALEKAKRKAAKRQEAERIKTAKAQPDDDEDEPVAETRSGRIKGRIVERWTERDYTVPSYEGSGTRRVVVTGRDSSSTGRSAYTSSERSYNNRGGFPNIFGAIFGGGD